MSTPDTPQGQPPYPPTTPAQQPYPAAPQPPYPPYSYPPAYGQPGAPGAYPPPYPYPYPYPPMPPQQPKQSHKALWITLSILGGVILLSCIACSAFAAISLNRVGKQITSSLGPTLTAQEFCSDMEIQDYDSAYSLFSANLQSQVTSDQWSAKNQARDLSDGQVSACTVMPNSNLPQGGRANLQIQITRNGDTSSTATGSQTGVLTIIQEGSQWKIDNIDASLGLTP